MPNEIGIKLDVKDRKILFELDFAARQSNAAIAKKVGLSKQGVDYRIKRLEKRGVIEGFYPVINIIRLGYVYGRLFIKFQNLTTEKEKEVYAAIVNNASFKWILLTEGNYELLVSAWTTSLSGFKGIAEQFIERFGQYIKEKKESIGIKVVHFQSRYLLGTAATKEIAVAEGPLAEVDNVERKLLKALCKDARLPVVELAAAAGVSPKAAAYRLKRLEKDGVLLGYRPNINHNLLGFTHYKILFYLSNVTKGELLKFREYLKQLPEVLYIVDEIGICDVDIELMLPSAQSLFGFISKIKFSFPTLIRGYEILIAKKTLKIDYSPFD